MRYYLSLVALLLASCLSETKDKQENTTNLVPADSLTVEVGMPTLIRCVGHQIFINNSFSRNYMIDAIDATNDSIMYSFAAKGQGDDEFLQIASMDVYHENNSQYLLLFDNMKRECITYHIDSLNRFKEFCKPGKKQKLPPTSRYLEVYKTNDFYIATGRTSKKYTLLEKDNLTRMRTYGDYLAGNDSDTDSMSISKANYGRQYIATGRDKMLSVVFMAGTISLYTIKSDSIQKTWDYTSSEFEYKKNNNYVYQQSPTGYLAADFYKDTIWGLYSGEKKKNGTNFGTAFHVLDMEGNLLKKYNITTQLYNFCIDSDNSLLYAISYNPDPKIVIYDLKK